MRLRADLLGIGLLLSIGLTGCGAPSPVAPAPAAVPSQAVATSPEAALAGTYQVQQYHRMMPPTSGLTPPYRPVYGRRPVYSGGMGRGDIYRMARWMAARDISVNAAMEHARLANLLRMRPDSLYVGQWRARQAALEARMRQMRLEMYYGPQIGPQY